MRTRSRDIKRKLGIGTGGFRLPRLNLPRFRLRLPRVQVIGYRRAREIFFQACVVVAVFVIAALAFGFLRPGVRVRVDSDTVAAFRVPHRAIGILREYAFRHGISFPELFAVFNAENGFFPEKYAVYDLSQLNQLYIYDFDRIMRRYRSRSIAPFVAMYGNLFGEIEVFPIPAGWYGYDIMFGDSWGVEHNFQGNRFHMGTAIMDRENIRGRVPVISMTRGTVRNAGWDNQLGYFVEIVTENNTVFLYAHFDSLVAGLSEGQVIIAGQPLGQMGNTGGGRNSRTFPVHLHVAISPDVTFTRGNFWINPYPLLRYIENPSGF